MQLIRAIFLVVLVFVVGSVILGFFNASPFWVLAYYVLASVFIVKRYVAKVKSDWRMHVDSFLHDRPCITDDDYRHAYFDAEDAEIAIKLRRLLSDKHKMDLSGLLPNDDFIKIIGYGTYFDLGKHASFVTYIGDSFGIALSRREWSGAETFLGMVQLIRRKGGRC